MAFDGAGAGRHRWDRLGDPPGQTGVAGVRPRSGLHRSPGGVHQLQHPAPGRQAGRSASLPVVRAAGHLHRGASVQPHVPDPHGAGPVRRQPGVPAARDRPGDLHQLRERASHQPAQAAVRHRPGRQVLSQRDHPWAVRVPHPGVRADGDGVLRGPRRGSEMVPILDRRAVPVVSRSGDERGEPAHPSPRGPGAQPLLGGHGRRRIPVPVGVGRARRHRQPHRLRPSPARRALRRRPALLRPGFRPAVLPPCHRTGRRRHSHHVRLPDRRLQRRRGRRREPGGVEAPPAVGAISGRRAAAVEEARAGGARHPAGGRPEAFVHARAGCDPVDRAPVPPSGRDRHAVLRDLRLRLARRSCGHRARSGHHGPGTRVDRSSG